VSFELKPREQVNSGLRRLVRKEIRAARRELDEKHPPTADAIHEARKSLKKVRAIVALIDDDEGRGIGRAKKRLRKIGHTLSELRDADAMVEIVDKLHRRTPRLLDAQTRKILRAWLTKRRKAAISNVGKKDTWDKLDHALRTVRRDARRWKPSHRAFGALSHGIAVSHRRGRKALARAAKRHRADDFHRWRKQIKNLWYELRLLKGAGPRVARDIHDLHQAEGWLGDDHNVVVLCAALSRDGSHRPAPITATQLKAAADRYHAQMRRQAIKSVRHIYTRKSGRYLRDLKRAWRTWRDRQRAR
jgi:CHAD domain-containing protein